MKTPDPNLPNPRYFHNLTPCTIDEINKAIADSKLDKSAGFDNVLNEFFKSFSNVFSPLLTKLFNAILNAGCYPTVWSQGIIVPIHKKGDVNNPYNYRGITLLSHISELFTSILNKRLLLWSEENNVVSDTQFGFKPGSGTRDAIFVLHSLISKTLNDKERLYCCFVDFKKAFDSIQHNKLWHKLVKAGINGKLFNIIRSMYNVIRSCVKLNGQFSEYFPLQSGLIQGDALSPMLFLLFINDLENELLSNCCQSIELQDLNLFLLLYADDTVLFSESVEGFQKMLDTQKAYTDSWKLEVNVSKTKMVVFRNVGKIKSSEKCFFMITQSSKMLTYLLILVLISSIMANLTLLKTQYKQKHICFYC